MIFLQKKTMVQYTIFKTVLLYLLKVYPSFCTRNQGTICSYFRHFNRKSSEINLKDDKTSIIFTVVCNISPLQTGNNLV